MRRVICVCMFLLLSVMTLTAQKHACDKGVTIIAGAGSFMSQGGDLHENWDKERFVTITLSPSLMHFVSPNFALGGSMSWTRQSQGNSSYSTLGVGPTLGYFIGDGSSNSIPFFAGGVRYQTMGDGDDSISGTDIFVGGGVLVLIRRHVAFSIEAAYHMESLKHKDWNESETGNTIAIGIGIAGIIY